ncbi:cyclic diguanylate phosphodiesterase, partial [Escherichia coli]|nr:cyclic diguanylate phosphodiesterase [Escherichia coli]
HLLYGRGVVDTLPELKKDEERYQLSSRHFPFTISVSGPSAGVLAFKHLPTQLPLAVLLSLLIGYIAWLATASRMSFSWEINLA